MRHALLLPSVLLLAACASPDGPQVELSPTASARSYASFSIEPVRVAGHRQDLEERFDHAVRRALEAKGYQFSDGIADLKVIYALGLESQTNVAQRPLITSEGSAWSQIEMTQEDNARLALRILDSRDGRVLFQAQINRQLHDPQLTQERFDQGVAELLAEFPPRR
ncbi:DUF4136 domain-containing protein [Zestomonas insulae]|nr:DUF4136 domain-containing protein [Pseudomonas insulae]